MPEHQQIQQSKKTNTIFQKQATPVVQTPVSNPYSVIQRAKINPKSLTYADIMQLQRTIGNQAVGRLLSSIGSSSTAQQATVQRQEIPEEEEPLQGKFENKPEIACPSCFVSPIVQRQEIPEEEEPLQGKMIGTVQRQEIPEEEEPLQTKKENNTGMPDNLKAGVENLSGIDMSDVRVQYNSSKPAEVGALAYTQGTYIHVAPGQEKHLPHEVWHVVQQAQGRVRPTIQMEGLSINNDLDFEREADEFGGKATQTEMKGDRSVLKPSMNIDGTIQRIPEPLRRILSRIPLLGRCFRDTAEDDVQTAAGSQGSQVHPSWMPSVGSLISSSWMQQQTNLDSFAPQDLINQSAPDPLVNMAHMPPVPGFGLMPILPLPADLAYMPPGAGSGLIPLPPQAGTLFTTVNQGPQQNPNFEEQPELHRGFIPL
jgi:hypothetical protein